VKYHPFSSLCVTKTDNFFLSRPLGVDVTTKNLSDDATHYYNYALAVFGWKGLGFCKKLVCFVLFLFLFLFFPLSLVPTINLNRQRPGFVRANLRLSRLAILALQGNS